MDKYILEMRCINKSFSGVRVVKGVTLNVKPGTVHALLGENGAGKSTLMKILTGMYSMDSGEIYFRGEPLENSTMRQVLKQGISMIYQELTPLLNMSIAENIYLGREPRNKFHFLNYKKLYENTKELFSYLNITNLNPEEKIKNLTVAKMQLVEIAKAISYQSRLIIMDEPTSSLTEVECEHLFEIVDMLKAQGIAFIFISHKLDEIYRIADEVTVLRDGEHIVTREIKGLDRNSIVSMMVGREVKQLFPKENAEIGDVAIRVENMSRNKEFRNVCFEARKGEIVGFSGLVGAGRSELMETIFGYRKASSGDIYINEKRVQIKSPADAIANKIALLTEDRKRTGLFLSLSIKDNMIMPSMKYYKKGPFLDHKKIISACQEQKTKFSLKANSFKETVNNLSGGNQQKVLVSRWLLTEPEIIILDEPTRGIDIGAKSDIHRFVSRLAAQGKCIIMISSELPEVMGMSDRIYVMHEGRITGCISREEATQENIMRLATGEKQVKQGGADSE